MAQFPEVDPATLVQALRQYITARQNVSALTNGGSANYLEVVRGWADALTATQNPSNAYFQQSISVLFDMIQQGGGGSGTTGIILFSSATPLTVGQWVYQVSSDTVDLADFSLASTGPAVGVVVGNPSINTVLVQNLGTYVYSPGDFPFLPMLPDTAYYIGAGGELTSNPNPPPGGYHQEIGYAKNTYQIVLNVQEPTLV